MALPRITVAIPFLNSQETLAYAIESVLGQDFQDFELILLNDGSTDASRGIANLYCADSRVRLVEDGRQLGLPRRLNQISAMARCFYLARMDADDVMHSRRLSTQIRYLDLHPEVDLVGTDVYFVDSNYSIIGPKATQTVRLCRRFSYLSLFHPTTAGRTSWFRANPYSVEFPRCEDTELWLRAGGGCNIRHIAEPLLFYNRGSSLHIQKTMQSLRQYEQILMRYSHRICPACRLREIAITESKKVAYGALALTGVVEHAIRYANSSSISAATREAAGELRSVIARAKTRMSQKVPASAPTRHRSCKDVAVGIQQNTDPQLEYPQAQDFFSPDEHYPEYPFQHISPQPNPVYRMVRELFRDMGMDESHYGSAGWNPLGEWIQRGQTVFGLVNFVTEKRPLQRDADFAAMLTHPSVIRGVLDYLIIATGDPRLVRFGNSPVQSASMHKLASQTSADRLREFYLRETGHDMGPHDLRLYISEVTALGSLKQSEELGEQDEITYDLGAGSVLEELPHPSFINFRVEDYGSDATSAYHSAGSHFYKIHRAVIESDVIFHIAKLKTHSKVGLTCALKGAVGAITRKECLAHHRCGSAKESGDEYRESTWLTKLYGALGKRATKGCANWVRIAHKNFGRLLDLALSINIRGSWYGNDTAWRMALDINRCLKYGTRNGAIADAPVRKIYSLLDGIISGEGDGPIHVRSRRDGMLLLSNDPCWMDFGAALVMGFDPLKIPLVREAIRPGVSALTSVSADEVTFLLNGKPILRQDIPGHVVACFKPPSGWVGHVEYAAGLKTGSHHEHAESIVGAGSVRG